MKSMSPSDPSASRKEPQPYLGRTESFNAVYLPRTARWMQQEGYSEEETVEYLESQREICHDLDRGRDWQETEVERAVETVFSTKVGRPKGRKPSDIRFSRSHFDELVKPGGEAALKKAFLTPGEYQSPKEFLSMLFGEERFFTVVEESYWFVKTHQKGAIRKKEPFEGAVYKKSMWGETGYLEEFESAELKRCSHICPNIKLRRKGTNKKGKPCPHALNQIGNRTYLVLESDCLALEEQWDLLSYFQNQGLPLVMVVSSGGKSLHGWFDVQGVPEKTVLRFFELGCLLGADPAIWNKAQWVRMPGGTRIWRDTGTGKVQKSAKQAVLLFSPDLEQENRQAPDRFEAWRLANPSAIGQIAESANKAEEGKPAGRIVATRNDYYVEIEPEKWVEYSEKRLKRHLSVKIRNQAAALGSEFKESDIQSEIDHILEPLERDPHLTGPFLFLPQGPLKLQGQSFINLSKVRGPLRHPDRESIGLDEAEDRCFSVLEFFANAFKPEQADHFLDWLRHFYVNALAGTPKKGIGMILVGPAGCGKGFLSEIICGGLMGGHYAADGAIEGGHKDATAWLVERGGFVDEVLDSPIHMLHDIEVSKHGRMAVTARIKKLLADGTATFHPKYGRATEIPYHSRLIIGLNDDEESLASLPDLNESIEDKLSILRMKQPPRRCLPPYRHVPTAKALPYFGRWLELTDPDPATICQRFGVKATQDREILEMGRRFEPEMDVFDIISNWHHRQKSDWTGTASELLEELVGGCFAQPYHFRAPNVLSRQLSKLQVRGKIPFFHKQRLASSRLLHFKKPGG